MSVDIAMQRQRRLPSRVRRLPAASDRHAHDAPRMIGFGLLVLALLLIGIGVATARAPADGGALAADAGQQQGSARLGQDDGGRG